MPDLNNFNERLETFGVTELDSDLVETLASEGFYATNNVGKMKCFYCNFSATWPQDNVLMGHEQQIISCARLREILSQTIKPTITSPTPSNVWDSLIELTTDDISCMPTNFAPGLSHASSISSLLSILETTMQPQLTTSEILSESPLSPLSLTTSELDPNLLNNSNITHPNPDNVISSEILFQPAYPIFKGLEVRENSFMNWPIATRQTASILSMAGFSYTQMNDTVICFCCGGSLNGWLPECDPWSEHAIWFPKCAYLKLQKGPLFILIAQTTYKTKIVTSPKVRQEYSQITDTRGNSTTNKCTICFKQNIQITLMPCKHKVSCVACTFSMKHCTICHNAFSSIIRVFP